MSKQKRKDLTDKIKKIHKYIAGAKQDENTGNFLSWLSEIEKEINAKKFGLVFEEHCEAIDETLKTHTPVLAENKKLFIDNGGQINFLIEGDNLAALQLLLKTHKGKVDVIYIDPPYNTGAQNWKYNNNYVDGNDLYKHSKFLSFMRSRLKLSKNILSKTGIIICAIDDYEVHNIRHLMDEIFGEQNRLGTIVVVHNPRGRNDDTFIATMHEYLLIYALNMMNAKVNNFNLSEDDINQYKQSDAISAFSETSYIRTGNNSLRTERPNLFYKIYYNTITNSLALTKSGKNDICLLPINGKNEERTWRWGKETFLEKKDTELFVKVVKGEYKIFKKRRLTDDIGKKPKTIWANSKYDASSNGIMLLQKIFDGKNPFPYPKSLYAVKDIIEITSNQESIVLDFFAGSGTTGHAVMKLNSEDNGRRKYILCTNNENNICRDVTYERIKRAIKKENYPASLKYYKIDFIPIKDKLYYEYADKVLEHIRELVELENAINFIGNGKIAIILTDEEMDDFVKNIKKYKNCRKLYRAHNILVSSNQAEVLKSAKIRTIVIPDYYYGELGI